MDKSHRRVDISECATYRDAVRDGDSMAAVAEEFDRGYNDVKRHVLGRCEHKVDTPALTREEAKQRHDISWVDCGNLREQAHQAETIIDVANGTKWSYRSVLVHVNGKCTHKDVRTEPINSEDRADNVSEAECEQLRMEYFDQRKSLDEVVANREVSRDTAWGHIRYFCSHYLPPEIVWKYNHDTDSKFKGANTPTNPLSETMYSDEIRDQFIGSYDSCLVSDVSDPSLLRVIPIKPSKTETSQDIEIEEGVILNSLLADAYRNSYFTFDTDGRLWVDPDCEFSSQYLTSTLQASNGIQVLRLDDIPAAGTLIAERNEDLAWWPHPRK